MHAAISPSNTGPDGAISRTMRVTAKASEIPRTRSALPTRSNGPVPVGWRAAYVSDWNGVRHTCKGCTRVGSSSKARNTTMVPSSKTACPWQEIGVATSLRIVL